MNKKSKRKGGEKMKVIISLSISYELIKLIDSKRGNLSRSGYISNLITSILEKEKEKGVKK